MTDVRHVHRSHTAYVAIHVDDDGESRLEGGYGKPRPFRPTTIKVNYFEVDGTWEAGTIYVVGALIKKDGTLSDNIRIEKAYRSSSGGLASMPENLRVLVEQHQPIALAS